MANKWNRELSIGEPSSETTALLEVQSTTKGSISMPVMTEAQRDAISSPATGLGIYNSDTNSYNFYNGTNWTAVGTGTGSGGINLFDGGDFEDGISLATVYDNTGPYTTGEGGSPSVITITQNDTTPLVGTNDLKITKASSDGSGEGITLLSEAVDIAYRGRNLFVQFEWNGTDANYTDGDYELKAYDVGTGATILPVVPVAGLNEDGTLPALKTKVVAYIPTTTDTDSTVRVSLHMASDSATGNAHSCYVDSARLGPDSVVPTSIQTPWTSWVPTGSWSTKTTYTGFERQVGQDWHFIVRVKVSGAPTSTSLTVNLPTNKNIDFTNITADLADNAMYPEASVTGIDAATGWFTGAIRLTSATTFDVFYTSVTAAGDNTSLVAITQAAPMIWASGDYVEISGSIPIEEYSNGASLSTVEAGLQTVMARYNSNAAQTIGSGGPHIINFEDEVFDTHNSVATGSSWKFTAPRTGKYSVKARTQFQSSTGWTTGDYAYFRIYKNGSLYSQLDFREVENSAATSLAPSVNGSDTIALNKGDYIDVRVGHTLSSLSLETDSALTYVSIEANPDFTHFSVYGEDEYIETEITSRPVTSVANTWVQSSETLVVPPGKWTIGYNVPLRVDNNSGVAGSSYGGSTRLHDGTSAVAKSYSYYLPYLGISGVGIQQTSNQVDVILTEETTYTIDVSARVASSSSTTRIEDADLEAGITGDDATSIMWARRR